MGMVGKLLQPLKQGGFILQKLVERAKSLIEGNEEFILLDEQKVAYEKIVNMYDQMKTRKDQKQVILIKGGPVPENQ